MQYFSKTTFQFLKDIKYNNDRDWFSDNKTRYDDARSELSIFSNALLDRLMLFDESFRDGEAPYLFRIYRDARYAKGVPYKTNLGALFLKGGRPAMCERAGYYFHIEPGNSFFGGGAHNPTPQWLGAIRDEIVSNPKRFKKILNQPDFKDFYSLEGAQLKTAPRGFPKDHPEIDLLRYKSFFGYHPLSDEQVLGGNLLDYLAKAFEAIYPLNAWLNACSLKIK